MTPLSILLLVLLVAVVIIAIMRGMGRTPDILWLAVILLAIIEAMHAYAGPLGR